MTAPWCLKRAELVMKCVKGKILRVVSIAVTLTWTDPFEFKSDFLGFLIEFPLPSCTLHFTLPLSIDSQVFQRIRDLIPENFRLTVALNI